jgi:Rhodopirellula transposase DDE domain
LEMIDEDSLRKLQRRNAAILPQLDERQRRLFAASEARAAGRGGIAAVSRVTRIAASTIGRGLKELDAPSPLKRGGVRRPGGGRKSLTETDPGLLDDLNALVEPDTRGDPMSPLRWTCKSLRRLAAELDKLGHKISHTIVGELLKKQKFSCKPIARRARAPTIPTATRNSTSSTTRSRQPWPRTSRLFQSIRRRRNWSAISPAANGVREAILKKCACTTS